MNNNTSAEDGNQDRFQVTIGSEVAWVEVVSAKNKIYAVELPGREPVFITQIKDNLNKSCWVSIPQGEDDLAEKIGAFIKTRKISRLL